MLLPHGYRLQSTAGGEMITLGTITWNYIIASIEAPGLQNDAD